MVFFSAKCFPLQVFLETRASEHSKLKGQVNHYIFTDSDIAVVDDLGQIFNDHPDFHVALTFRNNKEQPLNSGFIAVRGTPEGILRFVDLYSVLPEFIGDSANRISSNGDLLACSNFFGF